MNDIRDPLLPTLYSAVLQPKFVGPAYFSSQKPLLPSDIISALPDDVHTAEQCAFGD